MTRIRDNISGVIILKRFLYTAFIFAFMFMFDINICKADVKEDAASANVVSGGALTVSDTNKHTVKIGIGEEYALIGEQDISGHNVKCESSDESIASVSDDGIVHGIAKGKAVITIYTDDVKSEYNIAVKNKGFPYPSYEIFKGETLRIRFNGSDKVIKWHTDNKKIADVKKGYVTALKKGNAKITAYTENAVYSMDIKVVPAKKSVIYLTFDDGPSITSTPKILNILKKNDVKATFFVLNYDSVGEKLIKREAKEGHTVAIHGYSHDYGAIYKSEKAYMNNLNKLQNKLYKTIGHRTWITRFPGGSSNLVSRHYSRGIMRKLVKTVDKNGYAYFDWNVSSGDAGDVHTSGQVYRNVTRGLRKKRANVVLMHDFSGNTKTINALNAIIKYGKSHGYEFRTISDSTAQVHHNVQN